MHEISQGRYVGYVNNLQSPRFKAEKHKVKYVLKH